jgi:hypothetical protein
MKELKLGKLQRDKDDWMLEKKSWLRRRQWVE